MITFDTQTIEIGKIVCVGRNYIEHIQELQNEVPSSMVVFMKPSSCIGEELFSQNLDEQIHYESEICFLVKDGKFSAVGFGLDLTKRSLQKELKIKGLPWERAKAFDGAALFSEFFSFNEEFKDLSVRLFIDGELIQYGRVTQMIYKPEVIFQEINSFSKLNDFDIVMSGTPKGVGVVKSGSEFKGEILFKDKILVQKSWIAY